MLKLNGLLCVLLIACISAPTHCFAGEDFVGLWRGSYRVTERSDGGHAIKGPPDIRKRQLRISRDGDIYNLTSTYQDTGKEYTQHFHLKGNKLISDNKSSVQQTRSGPVVSTEYEEYRITGKSRLSYYRKSACTWPQASNLDIYLIQMGFFELAQ